MVVVTAAVVPQNCRPPLATTGLLLAWIILQHPVIIVAVATKLRSPIAMGVNGHPFSQPNYMVGDDFVASGSAAGISSEEQLDEVAALAPGHDAPSDRTSRHRWP